MKLLLKQSFLFLKLNSFDLHSQKLTVHLLFLTQSVSQLQSRGHYITQLIVLITQSTRIGHVENHTVYTIHNAMRTMMHHEKIRWENQICFVKVINDTQLFSCQLEHDVEERKFLRAETKREWLVLYITEKWYSQVHSTWVPQKTMNQDDQSAQSLSIESIIIQEVLAWIFLSI